MGALRRDEALQREKLRRKSSEECSRGKPRVIHRGGAKVLRCKYWEHWRRGACECKRATKPLWHCCFTLLHPASLLKVCCCATDHHRLLSPTKTGPPCSNPPR